MDLNKENTRVVFNSIKQCSLLVDDQVIQVFKLKESYEFVNEHIDFKHNEIDYRIVFYADYGITDEHNLFTPAINIMFEDENIVVDNILFQFKREPMNYGFDENIDDDDYYTDVDYY
jgi:hypothetical protein